MSLKRVNLNLIPVLREVLAHRSITGAGLALGRSPSAISEALAQLRLTLADPLIIRTGGRMVLTPRAIELIAPVEAVCAQLEGVFEVNRFDPLTTERQFVIAAHDFHIFHFGPRILALFRESAPGFSLRFVDLERSVMDRMLARDIDFALMPDVHVGQLFSSQMRFIRTRKIEMVILLRNGHPLTGHRALNEALLKGYPHIAFHPSWEPGDQETSITLYRRIFNVIARVPQITLLPEFVAGTDYDSIVPLALATAVPKELDLTYRALDMDYPSIDTALAWSKVQDADPAHQWFRTQTEQILI